jgi:hypothetical protein
MERAANRQMLYVVGKQLSKKVVPNLCESIAVSERERERENEGERGETIER